MELGAWVGEAKGSLELAEEEWFPKSANKSKEVEDFGVEVFDPLLALGSTPPTEPDD